MRFLPDYQVAESQANSDVFISSGDTGKSFMNRINKRRDMTEPCGTPFGTECIEDVAFPIYSCMVLS